MTKKEELLKKIEQRKANREKEIQQIPLPLLRKGYQQKLGSDEKMREFFSEAGDTMIKYWSNPVMSPILHHLYALIMPWVFKKQFRLGKEPRDFFDSVVDYCMFATSYGAWPMEISEVTGDRVVGYFDQCPGKCEKHYRLCLAITSMEPKISKEPYYGATVTFTERIPEGAKRCKVVFEKK